MGWDLLVSAAASNSNVGSDNHHTVGKIFEAGGAEIPLSEPSGNRDSKARLYTAREEGQSC